MKILKRILNILLLKEGCLSSEGHIEEEDMGVDFLTPATHEAEEFYTEEILLQSDIDAENDVYPMP